MLARSSPSLVIWLNANQVATGLALSLFGVGLLGVHRPRLRRQDARRARAARGAVARRHPGPRPAAVRAAPARLRRDRCSPRRSRGSSTARARASCCARSANRRTRRTRSATRCAGSARRGVLRAARCCGVGGAFLSVVYTPLWVEGHDRRPRLDRARARRVRDLAAGRVLLGAYLFGGVTMRSSRLQASGSRSPPVPVDAAVRRDDRRARDHLARPGQDPPQRAGLARQAVPSGCLNT